MIFIQIKRYLINGIEDFDVLMVIGLLIALTCIIYIIDFIFRKIKGKSKEVLDGKSK